jgi:hypothetical protein
MSRTRGYCMGHWQRIQKFGDPGGLLRVRHDKWTGKTCEEAGCERVVYAKGVCRMHYEKRKRRARGVAWEWAA